MPVSKEGIEETAKQLLDLGVGHEGSGWVIIRSGALGAFIESRGTQGVWVDAFWTPTDEDKVVDVTGQPKFSSNRILEWNLNLICAGAGNSFLGGLAAGLELTGGDVLECGCFIDP